MAKEHPARTAARRTLIDRIAVPAATAPSRSDLAGLAQLKPGELDEALGVPAVWRAVLRYHQRAIREGRRQVLDSMKRNDNYNAIKAADDRLRSVLNAWAPKEVQKRFPETTAAYIRDVVAELDRESKR